jgi:hypothetical protein
VYPNLTTTQSSGSSTPAANEDAHATKAHSKSKGQKKQPSATYRVSEAVAPVTMFQRMKGNTNSDLIEQTTKLLSTNAYRISEMSSHGDVSSSDMAANMAANARLLRNPDPRRATQRLKDSDRHNELVLTATNAGKHAHNIPWDSKAYWDTTCTLKKTGLGSKVDATPSSSTWKRNSTLY